MTTVVDNAQSSVKDVYKLNIERITRVVLDGKSYLSELPRADINGKEGLEDPISFAENIFKRSLQKDFPDIDIQGVKIKGESISLSYKLQDKENGTESFTFNTKRSLRGASFYNLESKDQDSFKKAVLYLKKGYRLMSPILKEEVQKNEKIYQEVKAIHKSAFTTKALDSNSVANDLRVMYSNLTNSNYFKTYSPAEKVRGLYPECIEFKFLNNKEAESILKLREIAEITRAEDIYRASRDISDKFAKKEASFSDFIVANESKAAMTKCEKEFDYLECKADIVDQFISEFPAIRHITGEAASILTAYQLENGDFESIKDIHKAYKAEGKRLEKAENEWEKEDSSDKFKDLSKAIKCLESCKQIEKNESSRGSSKNKEQETTFER